MSGTRRPTWPEILDAHHDSRVGDTYHALPGIVVAYHATTQTADVQIALDDPRFDPDTDVRSDEPWDVYQDMRVAWPRFGGFVVCGPLAPGDKVQVFFQDLDDSNFRVTGQQGSPPRSRRFGADAAFCLPWDLTDAGVAIDATAAASALIIGVDGGEAQIRIGTTTISLGATGADFVALASKVLTELGKIQATLATGTVTAAPGPVVFGTPYVPGSVASAIVKAD